MILSQSVRAAVPPRLPVSQSSSRPGALRSLIHQRIAMPLMLAILLIAPLAATAQTIEDLLGAIQNRHLVIEYRQSYVDQTKTAVEPIQWPGLDNAYPAPGTVVNADQIVELLRFAEFEYEKLLPYYLNYDPTQKCFINLRHWANAAPPVGYADNGCFMSGNPDNGTGAGRFSLSQATYNQIGPIDRDNWREKLILLSSNVNQLRSLEWPVTIQRGSTGTGYYFPNNDQFPDVSQLTWQPGFPALSGPMGIPSGPQESVKVDREDNGVDPLWDGVWNPIAFGDTSMPLLSFVIHGEAYDYTSPYSISDLFSGYASLTFATGIQAKAGPIRDLTNPTNHDMQGGKIDLLKGAVVMGFGDFSEKLFAPAESGITLGNLVPFAQLTGANQSIGTINTTAISSDNVDYVPRDSTVTSSIQWLGLQTITLTGSLVDAPEPALTLLRNQSTDGLWYTVPKVFSIDQGPAFRRGFDQADINFASQDGFSIVGRAVLTPNFPEFLSASAKKLQILRPRLAEIETTVEWWDLMRIHIGRGKTDVNQLAYLTSRLDGFGTLSFRGSPLEFEVLYDDQAASFSDAPIGGAVIDSMTEFTQTEQTKSGWKDRFSYICEWFSPRLKQVKGGDLFVNISYVTPYKKELRFYWAKAITDKEGKFYTIPDGVLPFKTIVLENPTVPPDDEESATPLPDEQYSLKATEDGQREWTASYKGIVQQANQPDGQEFNFSLGETGSSNPLYSDKITISYNETDPGTPNPETREQWEIKHTENGNVLTTKYLFGKDGVGNYSTPIFGGLTPYQTLLSNSANQARKIEYEWPTDYLVGEIPKSMACSGPADWAENGSGKTWDDKGRLETEHRTINGKSLELAYDWTPTKCTTTAKLGGSQFYQASRTIAPNFKTETFTVNGEAAGELTYEGADGVNPWMPTKMVYPNGYQDSVVRENVGSDTKITFQSGWGAQYSSGTKVTETRNRFGGLKTRKVETTEGVVLANDTGLGHTDWGAPTSITHLRGQSTYLAYDYTGLHWGKLQMVCWPDGTSDSVYERDWLSRPTYSGTECDKITADYSQPLSTTINNGMGTRTQTVSTFHDFQSFISDIGDGLQVNKNADGSGALTAGGRTVPVAFDPSQMLKSIGSGLGARGEQFDLGVENGKLYTEVIPLRKDDTADTAAAIRTLYDGFGRPVLCERLSAANTSVSDSWSYTDQGRTVTYTPGAGPLAESTVTSTSTDGAVVSVTKNGSPWLEQTRSATNGKIEWVTKRRDAESSALLKVASDTTFEPATGTTITIPWGIAANAITRVDGPPDSTSSVTISDGLSGDTLTLGTGYGRVFSAVGRSRGVDFSFWSIDYYPDGTLGYLGGDIGGKWTDIGFDASGKLIHFQAPGVNKSIVHGGQPGFSTTVTDFLQGTTSTVSTDSVGDLVSSYLAGEIALNSATTDTGTGSQTTLNGNLTFTSNRYGATTGKAYSGGITEAYGVNPDGSPAGHSVSGPGWSMSASMVTQNPAEQTTYYTGARFLNELFYPAGLRSQVATIGDKRTFKYQRYQLTEEAHVAGTWSGWKVEQVPDARGRVGSIRISENGTVRREFTCGYDGDSRLTGTQTPELISALTRDAAGRPYYLNRGGLNTQWSYSGTGVLAGVNNTLGSTAFYFSYPNPDTRNRICNRNTSSGVSWQNMTYHSTGGLAGATLSNGRQLAYNYDDRGNRTAQGAAVAHVLNPLDQITKRTLTTRGYGILGSVDPHATVKLFHPLGTPDGESLAVNNQTGYYGGWWTAPSNFLSSGGRVDATLRGTYPGAGDAHTDAVAESDLHFQLPPTVEDLGFDGVGRLTQDAFWTYGWATEERMSQMIRKPGMILDPNVKSEVIDFVYDAEGRRTKKTRTLTFLDNTTRAEVSKVLWCGWLPVMEDRSGYASASSNGRRWFQWGPDLSGTFDGAGGIGGLYGIIEELTGGGTRVLLPIQDGLGNITAVVNAANNAVVARYDYGPFGEPLGESGEVDVCPFRWQTRLYDQESQQYVFPNGRPYEPRLGRFKSRDPIGEEGGLNVYAYCNNDPLNRHDPLGFAEISPNAPTNEAIQNQIQILTGLLPLMQDAALAHNSVDCIGWRPSQRVNTGADGSAVQGEIGFLNRVLKARAAIGPNGYGEAGMDKVLYREFGSLDESILPYFEPAGGYMTRANTRANMSYIQTTAGWYLNATMMALPLPVPRGFGIAACGVAAESRAALPTVLEGGLGPIIDMVPDATGTLVPAFEAQTLALPGRAPIMQLPAGTVGSRVLANYQRYYNEAWRRAVREFNLGKRVVPMGVDWKTVLGQRTDSIARGRLLAYLEKRGIPEGPGQTVLVNRWLRDPSGSGAYRIPDIQIPGDELFIDGTIGAKDMTWPQMMDCIQFSGGHRGIIVRPQIGPIFGP